MNIYDFITEAELDDAPDDSRDAFAFLINIAQKRLGEFISAVDDNDNWSFESAHYDFFNLAVSLAKSFGIEGLATYELPSSQNFNMDYFRTFKADLDHVVTQIIIAKSVRGKRGSVSIPDASKERILNYTRALREAVDASEFSDSKKSDLRAKIAAFEEALDKKRLKLGDATAIAFAILAAPGSLWASYEVVSKLTTNILQVVGEAKSIEDQNKSIPDWDSPVALIPNRRNEGDKKSKEQGDLDDEIPF